MNFLTIHLHNIMIVQRGCFNDMNGHFFFNTYILNMRTEFMRESLHFGGVN